MKPIIHWVNHASFILEFEGIRLLSDPWIEGMIFNDSWSLLVPTQFRYEDFDSITHLWFSHEHPDHFNPPNIKKIQGEIRKKIEVYFQETLDKRVVGFCDKLGFKKIVEMKPNVGYNLSPTLSILNTPAIHGDSWLFMKTPEYNFLNLNDCFYGAHSREAFEKIQKTIGGKVDVLFTQFSYANWAGNPDDKIFRKQCARDKIEEIKQQVAIFKPKYVVPFASYVWFSHKENFFMNDLVNRIDDIYAMLKELGTIPIVLYPGQRWEVGSEFSSKESIEKYLNDFNNTLKNPALFEHPTFAEIEVQASAKKFREQGLKLNDNAKLNSYLPFSFYVTDWKKSGRFSYKKGWENCSKSEAECDISLSSQALKYCFDFSWGFGTLNVSGRYAVPKGGNYRNVGEYAWIAELNANGKSMKSFGHRVMERIKEKLGF